MGEEFYKDLCKDLQRLGKVYKGLDKIYKGLDKWGARSDLPYFHNGFAHPIEPHDDSLYTRFLYKQ